MRAAWLLGLALPCIMQVSGCGPSFQALYDGDARFEHCYALEDDGSGTMQKRADCWRDWVDHYTFGQTRDRVQYATSRYKALTSSALPTDEGMMSAAPGAGNESAANPALAPTNAFAPPPTTATAQASSAPTSTWMTTAPQQILPDAPRDAGVTVVAPANGRPASTTPVPSASQINPTILPPPPPPPMKKPSKK